MADVTHSEKVRGTFDEFDTKRARSFALEDWLQVLTRLRFDFAVSTMRELFDKVDSNRDGVATFAEYSKFMETYPTLLDSLYFRAKDHWTDVHQRQEIEDAKAEERRAREEAQTRTGDREESRRVLENQEHRYKTHVLKAKEAQDTVYDASEMLQRARSAVDAASSDMRLRAEEHAAFAEEDRTAGAAHSDARQAAEASAAQLRDGEAELAREEDLLRELERRVEEHRRLVGTLTDRVCVLRNEAGRATAHEQASAVQAAEMTRTAAAAGDRLAGVQQQQAQAVQQERDASDVYDKLAQDLEAAQRTARDEEAELLVLKERETRAREVEEAAKEAHAAQQRVRHDLEQQNRDFNAQRADVERDEGPLLEQELNLRRQRELLESHEARLRSTSSLFSNTRRSASPAVVAGAAGAYPSKPLVNPAPAAPPSLPGTPSTIINTAFQARTTSPRRHTTILEGLARHASVRRVDASPR